jgi:8-oxo-dGTP pyrophosphatase MutT (NUDIX family)
MLQTPPPHIFFLQLLLTSLLLSISEAYLSLQMSTSDKNLPKINDITPVAKTKWIELRTIDWTDQDGVDRKWDYVARTTKPEGSTADAVIIIPLLKKYGSSETLDTILVEQFRPPLGRKTCEFPAGLIDKNETPEQAALRELREETGYVGEACKTVPLCSRPVCMSPGLTDETVIAVMVTVDLDNPYNQNPKAELDDGEHIVLKRVSLKDGIKQVLDQGSSMPIDGLYMFALGLDLGKSLAIDGGGSAGTK